MQALVDAVVSLAAARHLEDVTRAARTSARALSGADGATFILRDGAQCFYVDEDAIAPLWKGQRFPMEACVSGWSMSNRQPVAIEDITLDARIPQDAYRPTFVKSLLIVPIGDDPVAAIGLYWATRHRATSAEIQMLQTIAHAAALALANVQLNSRLEESLQREREARHSAEAANRLKDDFLATVSHELRTPLHVIQSWTWQLKRAAGTDRTLKRAAEVIDRNAQLQSRLVQDLLDSSHSRSGKLRLRTQLVDLEQICTAVLEVCELAARAKKLRIDFERNTAPRVWGDPERLQQILWNVLTNAIKFTPENGRIQLVLARTERHASITVNDTGIGVAPEFLPRMFDRFSQADSGPTRQFGGLGIGLSIVKDLVESHGGRVRAESRGAFQGTTVAIELPIPALMDQPQRWQQAVDQSASTTDLRDLTILIVDDDREALVSLENLLAHHGATVLRASCVDEALALLNENRPAVLLSDLSLPDRDGIDLIRSVRSLATPLSNVPAAALSAYAASDRAAAANAAGFQLYLEKPVQPEILIGHLAQLARESAS